MQQKQHRIFDFVEERNRVLNYLYSYRNQLNKLTHTQIINAFKYSKPTFNRIIYYLEGAGLITDIKVGNANICQITKMGEQKIGVNGKI